MTQPAKFVTYVDKRPLRPSDVLQLQHLQGNNYVQALIGHKSNVPGSAQKHLQRQAATAASDFAQQDVADWEDVHHQESAAKWGAILGFTPTRQAILDLARSQIGTVNASNRGDGNKTGWQRILRFYEVAFEGAKVPGTQTDWFEGNFGDNSSPEAAAQSNKRATKRLRQNASYAFDSIPKGETYASMKAKDPQFNPGPWSWCGMFAVWAVKSVTGRGGWANSKAQGLPIVPADQAKPGDIVHFNDSRQHHAILAKPLTTLAGDSTLTIIEGNGHYQAIGESSHRKLSEVAYFYQAVPDEGEGQSAQASGSSSQTPVQRQAVRRQTDADGKEQTVVRLHPVPINVQRQSLVFNSIADQVINMIHPTPVAGSYEQAYKILNGRWMKELLEILQEIRQKGYLSDLISNFGLAQGIHRPRLLLALQAAQLQGSITVDNLKQQFAAEFTALDKNPDQQQLILNFLSPPATQPAAVNNNAAFSVAEAQQIQQTWATSGSYTVSDSGDQLETQAYMQWRAKAQKAIGTMKPDKAKEAQDWLNKHEAHEQWNLHKKGAEPENPGATPADLSGAHYQKNKSVGAAPAPAFRDVKKYDVTLPNNQGSYSFRDDPIKRPYHYMKNETGVAKFGQKVSDRTDTDALFQAAGITDSVVIKVMKKVSTEEGGFEAVNTYDTGYISVGFIQFISGQKGTSSNSLITLLQTLKQSDTNAFKTYFHALGIDVDQQGLTVVDPATGNLLQGEAAVQAVMNDKRLTAVFHHAGKQSEAFRVAQIKTAYNLYYMPVQSFTIKEGQTTISGKYGDVLQSEAGKAALMDRGVQKGVPGTKTAFANKCKQLIKVHNLTSIADLAKYEAAIIPEIKNRIDVLNDNDLSQPGAVP